MMPDPASISVGPSLLYESANASLIDCAKDISLAIWFAPAVPADVFGFRTYTKVAQTYVSIVRDFQAVWPYVTQSYW